MLLEKFSLVFQALFAPRKVYRKIQTNEQLDASLFLIVAAALTAVMGKLLSSDVDMKVLLKILVLIGSIVGSVITTILFAHLLGWVSGFFKKGDAANNIRLALPYSFLPAIIANVLILFVPAGNATVISICASIWSIIILGFLLAEIKKFSFVKGVITVVLTSVLLSLPFLLVMLVKES